MADLNDNELVPENARILTDEFQFVRRHNHFEHWLLTVWTSERMDQLVPDAVMEQVRTALALGGTNNVSVHSVKAALRTANQRKYLDYAPQITARLRGQPLSELTNDQKQEVLRLFDATLRPYARVKGTADACLPYPYVTYKLCELAGYTELMPLLRLLSGEVSLAPLDVEWEAVCVELGWRFVATEH